MTKAIPHRNLLTLTCLVSVLLASAFALVWMRWTAWHDHLDAAALIQAELVLEQATSEVARLDEVLTMSAKMYVYTEDPAWRERYDTHAPRLDEAIATVIRSAPGVQTAEDARRTEQANRALVEMETQAFVLTETGRAPEAVALLESEDYRRLKSDYAKSNEDFYRDLEAIAADKLAIQHRHAVTRNVVAICLLTLLFGAWAYVLVRLRRGQVALVKEKEGAIDSANAAEAASRAKSDFLANMSHEIRTPMTAIMGYTDLLRQPGLAASDRDEYTHTIKRNGEQLLAIINDILDLSKIESRMFNVESIPTPVVQTIEEVASLMRVQAIGKNIELKTLYEGKIPDTIQSDPTRLRQVLTNLVGNAIKFTPAGSVTIRTTCDLPAMRLHVDVTDTGIGMTPEQQRDIFKAFTQADTSTTRKWGGTGLGLHISMSIAKMLGGEITLRSAAGRGSTFTATVPTGDLSGTALRPVQPIRPTTKPEAQAAATPVQALSNTRILLAEDGPDNQHLISFHLKKAGAQVHLAENGRLAVAAVQDAEQDGKPFDIVLMDMQMPEMDGYQATRQLRHQGHALPVIALTAHAMHEDRQKCLDAGCSEYTTKPIERDTLIGMCVKCLRR